MMLLQCCSQYSSKSEESTVLTGLERSVFIPIPKKGNAKENSNYRTIALISHASKCSKFSKPGFNSELPAVQAGFRKGRGTRDQISSIRWIIEKAREFQKNTHFCITHYASILSAILSQHHLSGFEIAQLEFHHPH